MRAGGYLPFNLQFEIDNYSKYNKSTWFLLPCFSDYSDQTTKKVLKHNYLKFRFEKEYIDSYLQGIPEYDNSLKCPLYLRYKWENTEDFKEFEEFITSSFKEVEFIATEDYEGESIYVFNVLNEDLYTTLIKGDYSKFPDSYKIKCLEFFNLSSEGIICRIFRKDQVLYQVRKMFLGCLKGNNCTCNINLERNQAGELINQNYTGCKYFSNFEFPDRYAIELESPPDIAEETVNFII